MTVAIRRFEQDDAVAASDIIRACFTTLNLGDYSEAGVRSQLEENSPRRLVEHSQGMTLFVATIDGRLVGLGGHDASRVRTLFVDSSLHRSGVGSLILSTVLAHARKQGIGQLGCWSTPFAEPFYSRNGFKRVGVLDNGDVRFVRMTVDL